MEQNKITEKERLLINSITTVVENLKQSLTKLNANNEKLNTKIEILENEIISVKERLKDEAL